MDLDALQVSDAVVHYIPTTTDESLLLTDQAIALAPPVVFCLHPSPVALRRPFGPNQRHGVVIATVRALKSLHTADRRGNATGFGRQ